jgi:hypothetical protein
MIFFCLKYLDMALDIGERLLPAFDTPTGILLVLFYVLINLNFNSMRRTSVWYGESATRSTTRRDNGHLHSFLRNI